MSQSKKRVVFAGTPQFAAESLKSLLQNNFSIALVMTQPDRPSGRGRSPKASPVKALALNEGIPVWQPLSLKGEEAQQKLAAIHYDFMVVVAYGLLIPASILSLPEVACVNLHASLLPRWRGAAPIQRAIEAGDQYTGACVMKMDVGLDTGPVASKLVCPISDQDTSGSLHDRLSVAGAELLADTLTHWEEKHLIDQIDDEATYARKIEKAEAEIDWSSTARAINLKIRAFNPWPVCYTSYVQAENKADSVLDKPKEVLRIWAAHLDSASAQEETDPLVANGPGMVTRVSNDGVSVMTADGQLVITCVQRPGARPMSIAELLNGRPDYFKVGTRLGVKSS